MIGETVTETVADGDKLWIKVSDDKLNDSCSTNVVNNGDAKKIKPGDCVWWQGKFVMWTPYENRGEIRRLRGFKGPQKAGVDYDIQIPRVGFSGVARPNSVN